MTHDLRHYRLLGRSGLRVSPIALGTMTFGNGLGWGADDLEAQRMLDVYCERGGNFVDTANSYGAGGSESLLAKIVGRRRHRLVLATKYTLAMEPENPNAAGNHRKNMVRGVEESLRRLETDYIDLLYLHMWDGLTPVEEIVRAFDDLVRAGKVLYIGISDTPAWQVSRMQVIAELRGWAPFCALQTLYNLAERTGERDLMPMASEMGLGVIPWSPLAGGVLSGKYGGKDLAPLTGTTAEALSGSRKDLNLVTGLLNDRTLAIATAVHEIAEELSATPSQIAIAWTLLNPTVTAPILGVRTLAQLEDNLGALEVAFQPEHIARLDTASRIELGFPHDFLAAPLTAAAFGGFHVSPHPR